MRLEITRRAELAIRALALLGQSTERVKSSVLAKELSGLLKETPVLGLNAKSGVPTAPEGPAIACKIVVDGTDKPVATVEVATSNPTASLWLASGKFTLPVAMEDGKIKVEAFADALAEGILGRLVRAQVKKTDQMVKGKAIYKVRIDNASPLILNGVALLGAGKTKTESTPKNLAGIGVSPFRSMTLPITSDMVDHFGLRKDVRVIGADLSGL